MLIVVAWLMLSLSFIIVMRRVIILSVIRLNVVAPSIWPPFNLTTDYFFTLSCGQSSKQFTHVKRYLHWQCAKKKCLKLHETLTVAALALATLGHATQIGSIVPINVALNKVAYASAATIDVVDSFAFSFATANLHETSTVAALALVTLGHATQIGSIVPINVALNKVA